MNFQSISLYDFVTKVRPRTKMTIFDVERQATEEMNSGSGLKIIVNDIGYGINLESIKNYFTDKAQGGEAATRLAHTQEIEGSTPSPATKPDKELYEDFMTEDGPETKTKRK